MADPAPAGLGLVVACGRNTRGRARERRPAALPRRQATAALKAPPPRPPRWPEGQAHPNPPTKAGKGALRRAHPDEPHLFRRP